MSQEGQQDTLNSSEGAEMERHSVNQSELVKKVQSESETFTDMTAGNREQRCASESAVHLHYGVGRKCSVCSVAPSSKSRINLCPGPEGFADIFLPAL